jgi:hypothetical protein
MKSNRFYVIVLFISILFWTCILYMVNGCNEAQAREHVAKPERSEAGNGSYMK